MQTIYNLPPQWIRDLSDEVAYLRGRFLTSYAQCEFLLADLSVRIDSRFRYALDKRINATKIMAETDGPLNQYSDELLPLLEHLPTYSERRHWLAHGFLELIHDKKQNHLVKIRRYIQEKDDRLQIAVWEFTVQALRDDVAAITIYGSTFVGLWQRIYSECGLS